MKWIVFDFDGTLADTFSIVKNIVEEYRGDFPGKDFKLEEMRNNDLKVLIKKFKIPFYKLLKLSKEVKDKMGKKVPKAHTFQGIKKLLKNLSKEYRLGILSSNSEMNIKLFLKNNSISQYFDFIYSDSSVFGKDVVIKKMMKEKNIDVKRLVYIGDEQRDVVACKKLKIPVIAVTWGYNSKKFLRKSKPDFIVNKPKDIMNVLKDI